MPKRVGRTNLLTAVKSSFNPRQKLFQRVSKALLTAVKSLVLPIEFFKCLYAN